MTRNAAILARAVTDGDDRLISADEPLAGLQLRCGGELPGVIAIPALLEAVRKARLYQLKLARSITAQDGREAITAWVEAKPKEGGEDGCDIVLRSWRSLPLPAEDPADSSLRRNAINRQVAEFSARLDAQQKVLTVECEAPDLAELERAMKAGIGRAWTDFVTVEGTGHRQPMHWRLLDGARVKISGSDREWRASLVPHSPPGFDPDGFELLLAADAPLPRAESGEAAAQPEARPGVVGNEIAPVLRQPLSRIIANAESIRTRLAGPLSDDYADYAADISAAGQHLLGLLDDLADLEIVESDDFTTTSDRIDLADVARQAAGILGVRAKEKRIEIDAPRHGESLEAIAEQRRALQILLNLVGNAIRYSPEDSQIWLRLDDSDGKARITIADQGPGLSKEECEAVFRKFERLGRSGDGGSGLGLYISRRLAKAMKGELSVESAPGQGARFVLELPLAPAETGQSGKP